MARSASPRKARSQKRAVRRAAKRPTKAAKKAPRRRTTAVVRAKPKKAARAARPAGPAKRRPAAAPRKIQVIAKPVAEARPLRIVVFGASGNIGSRIVAEALHRGHHVTAVMRNPGKFAVEHPQARALRADVTDPILVSSIAKGHDAIVSAIAPTKDDPHVLADAAHSVLDGAREAGIRRVMVVNGAGSLMASRTTMLMDTPQFPQEYRWIAQSHKDALDVLRAEGGDLDWTAVSPAAEIDPGKRTGKFRVGGDELVADAKGRSRISMEDYAAAFLDELEGEHYLGKRMTVAY